MGKLPIYSAEKALFASKHDNVAERSKAVRSGRIPKGREFESHSCQIMSFSWLRKSARCSIVHRPWNYIRRPLPDCRGQ